MKANETRIDKFLSLSGTQFVIPVYQRDYDWTLSQCGQLFNDIFEAGKNSKINAHFLGSIVCVEDGIYTSSDIRELTIIDGQQRLTTITLIYLAIYHLAKELNNQQLESKINETYLINKFASEEEKLKLKPTENNNKALKYLLRADKNEEFKGFSRLVENFRFFRTKITAENYKIVLEGLSKLIFVEISLDRTKDNPQRIFESLNSTGLELTQSDLIRNYILMGLNRKEQDKIYRNYWQIIESLAKDEKQNKSLVSDFIRDFLTLENKKIPNKKNVYAEFKNKYTVNSFEELEQVLGKIKSLAKYYNKLLNPKNEQDNDIRRQLEYINKLEINVAYPFLMKVYEDYADNLIEKQVFIHILEFIQSFVWRRFIVGLPTNALNKIFMTLYDKVIIDNCLISIHKALLEKTGVQRFPRNKEVMESLRIKDVYNINSKNRTYLFQRLENYDNTEFVPIEGNPNITIEHIFPQNPDRQWKTQLSIEEFNFIKENYLNTIANLTLSGNNGKLSNKTFQEKRDLPNYGYKDSRLWLNKPLSTLEKWDKESIENRFSIISEQFLKIWQIPDIEINDDVEEAETNIFDADEPTYRKLEYAVFMGEKIEVSQVAVLYTEVFKKLFELDPEKLFSPELSEKIGLTKNKDEKRQPSQISDSYFIEGGLGNDAKFEKLKLALTIFDLEDELFIKYKKKE